MNIGYSHSVYDARETSDFDNNTMMTTSQANNDKKEERYTQVRLIHRETVLLIYKYTKSDRRAYRDIHVIEETGRGKRKRGQIINVYHQRI